MKNNCVHFCRYFVHTCKVFDIFVIAKSNKALVTEVKTFPITSSNNDKIERYLVILSHLANETCGIIGLIYMLLDTGTSTSYQCLVPDHILECGWFLDELGANSVVCLAIF